MGGRRRQQKKDSFQGRMRVVLLFFLVLFAVLLTRLFLVQLVHHQEYRALADRQHSFEGGGGIRRGTIFIQDNGSVQIPVALMGTEKILAANPQVVENVPAAAEFLSREFSLEVKEITEKISKKNDSYEVLARDIDVKKAQLLASSLPKGIFFENRERRVYPHGAFAAHILGFTSQDQQELRGRYGLERFYDESLSGKKGFFENPPAPNAVGFWLGLGRKIISPPEWGARVVTTIDYNIQRKAEEVLTGLHEKWSPVSGLVLVTNPRSGKILAETAFPSFDPNDYGKIKDFHTFLNPMTEAAYEFGSVIKPVTMASAIEEGVVGANTTYYDSGEVRFGSYVIHNFDLNAYHTQTMTQVLEKSLNTGAVFVARLLGKKRQLEYLKRFGFGEKTGVDLPGEVRGNLNNLFSGRDINFATASFGQGISATPLQLASAIGTIANNGILMKPYVVEKIVDDSGNETLQNPKESGRVISKETAETVSKMLVSVVRNGFENKAGVKGYFVAGKTGTAQIPKKDGKGYSDKAIHTFVGYAPAFSPRFLILLQLNEPIGNRFAANTLTPAFHDLAEYILHYYQVLPDEQ